MPLSNRSDKIKPQPMFKIMQTSALLKKSGKKIINLEIGDTSSFNNVVFKNILKKNVSINNLGYTLSAGISPLREYLAKKYSKEYSSKLNINNIIISTSNALISEVLISICNKGDQILIPSPGFPTYGLSADALGIKKIYYKLKQNNNWQPDIDEINKKIINNKNRLKAIFINSPSNPLGIIIEKKIINDLIKLAIKHKLLCIIDQTYYDLYFLKNDMNFKYSKYIFFIHTFSKSDAIPGVRMGFGIGDERIIRSIENINSLFFSSQPKFIQESILEYLKIKNNFSEKIKKNLIKRSNNCLKILEKSNKISFVKPNGGIFIFLNIEKISNDSNQFSLNLLNKCGVCVCPGNAFGPNGKKYIRINLGGNEKDLYIGCHKIINFIEKF